MSYNLLSGQRNLAVNSPYLTDKFVMPKCKQESKTSHSNVKYKNVEIDSVGYSPGLVNVGVHFQDKYMYSKSQCALHLYLHICKEGTP